MRCVGLDLGTKRLGVAISDKSNTIVTPLIVIDFKSEDYIDAYNKLKNILSNYEIDKIVLGLPRNMDGSYGYASKRSYQFKELLEKDNYEVVLEDERMSTIVSESIIHGNNDNIRNTKEKIDAIEAGVILESYLKRINHDSKE